MTEVPMPEVPMPLPRDPGNECLRCNGPLDVGFIEDTGEAAKGRARWIPGPIQTGPLGGTRVMGKDRYDIEALRCRSCGRLELRVS
jgi:hypothetical protein